MKNCKKIKTLLIYLVYNQRANLFYSNLISRLKENYFDVEGFCLTIDPPNNRLDFRELDYKWKTNDKKLLSLYDKLKKATKNKDVLVLFNGANLHPEFLAELKTFNAYMCFDDPESSDNLSKPVAKYFDACFVGNIASINQYYSWGCKNVFFRPLGYSSIDIVNSVNEKFININNKNIDTFFLGEKVSIWRKERLNYLEKNIDNFFGAGKGWDKGYIPQKKIAELYKQARIGLNIHNSTGPINLRTYTLPANGIMQICDNKYFLGHIFELNKEVVGFCDIEEVPDLVNYYLKNDNARKKIAVNGRKRAVAEYNEVKVWEKQITQISKLL